MAVMVAHFNYLQINQKSVPERLTVSIAEPNIAIHKPSLRYISEHEIESRTEEGRHLIEHSSLDKLGTSA